MTYDTLFLLQASVADVVRGILTDEKLNIDKSEDRLRVRYSAILVSAIEREFSKDTPDTERLEALESYVEYILGSYLREVAPASYDSISVIGDGPNIPVPAATPTRYVDLTDVTDKSLVGREGKFPVVVDGKLLLSDFPTDRWVDLTTDQNINGNKTFLDTTIFSKAGVNTIFNTPSDSGSLIPFTVNGVEKSFFEWNVNENGTTDGEFFNIRNNQGPIGLFDSTETGLIISGGNTITGGSSTANSFIKTGGTSNQYLKADGSISEGIPELSGYVPYTGATNNVDLNSRSLTAADVITKAPIADVRAYGTIAQAVTAIGSTNTTLLIPNAQTVSTSLTIPSNIKLQVERGGIITIDSGQTLTINGGLKSGLHQIFTGSGLVTFGMGVIERAYPQWWYTGAGSWHTAINQAMVATSLSGIEVFLVSGTYTTSGTIVVGDDNVLNGFPSRYTGTIINYSGSGTAIQVKDQYKFGTVKNIALTGGTAGTAIGILVARPYTLIDNIFIYAFSGAAAIKVTDSGSDSGGYLSRIKNITIYGNPYGVASLGGLTYGIWLSSQANAVEVSNVSINYPGTTAGGGAGLYIDGGVGIFIDNINVENGYSAGTHVNGILVNGGASINLKNPYFENNNKNLVISNGFGIIVDNIYTNGFNQSSVGIQVNSPASRVMIRGGYIASIAGSGTDIELVGSPENVQIKDVRIEDSSYTGNSVNGIDINNGSITVGDIKGQNHSTYTPKFSTVSTTESTRLNAMDYFNSDTNSALLNFGKARGTLASPIYPAGNDILGRVSFSGWNEANNRFDIGADYNVIANGTWSASNRGTTHEWYITPTGSTTRAIGMTLTGLGDLTTVGKITLADEAYSGSWNGKLEAPTKNAIWDAGFTSGSGTTSYIPKFTSSTGFGNSLIYDDGSNVGIGTTSPYGISNYRFITTNQTTGGGLVMQTAGVNKGAIYNTSSGVWIEGGLITIGTSGLVASTGVKIATLTGTGTEMVTVDNAGNLSRQAIPSGGGGGTVVSVGVSSANGFAGSSSGGTNPSLTLSTTVTADVLKANGTSISAASTTGTSGSAVVLATSPTLVSPALGTPTALVGTNITGTATGLTAGNIVSQANSATIASDATATINTIALRDANGDIAARTFVLNPAYGDFAPNKLVGTSAGGQIREMSLVQAQTYLGLGSNAYTSTAYYPNSNPSGFITASSTDTLTNKSGNISQWTNNSGYITASSSSALTNKTGSISQWTNDSGYITAGSSSALTNKTGAISQWTNDSGYITASSTSTLTNKSGNISQWTNNSGYLTSAVTSVSAGSGMSFSTISGTGAIAMGTPSSITAISTNGASGTTHSHALISIPSATTATTQTAGDNSTKVATTAYVDKFELDYGTYTPSVTNVSNVSSTVARKCQYSRVGNIVTVSGAISIDPISGGGALTIINISLPIASAFTSTDEANGQGTGVTGFIEDVRIRSDVSGFAQMEMVANNTLTGDVFYTYQYEVINAFL